MSDNTRHPNEDEDRWICKKEVLRRMGISVNTLKKMIASGEIHPIILGPNSHRYSENEIKYFMTKKSNKQAALKAEILTTNLFQDEEMDRLYDCEWQEEISKYK